MSEDILRRRLQLLIDIGEDSAAQQIERELCRRDFFRWVENWVWTFDPRLASERKPAHLPFIMFPRQKEMAQFIFDRLAAREDGLIEKSRDIGFTWVLAAVAVWAWLFIPGFKTTFGSRVEMLVDKRGEVDSIFEKMRYILRALPPWFTPQGFDWKEHDNHMRLINPDNGNTVAGEAGRDIGRGGRAQPLDAKVLTPQGWVFMGQVRVGDEVIGGNGRPVKVVAIHPQGEKQVFRVRFNDGSSTECCDEHLWRVTTKLNRKAIAYEKKNPNRTWAHKHEVWPVAMLRQKLNMARSDGQIERQFQIPMVPVVHYAPQPKLVVHPYIIGSLIGDGCVAYEAVSFTTADMESVETIRSLLPPEHLIVKVKSNLTWSIRTVAGSRGKQGSNLVRQTIKETGLQGHTCYSKFIPDLYKRSSPENRLWLLRGLLDTDGWVGVRRGDPSRLNSATKTCFCTVSKRLADDVREVVQSLGGIATVTRRPPSDRAISNGKVSKCVESFNVNISLPNGLNPFCLSRKADIFKPRRQMKFVRSIVSIEPTRVTQTQCITVDSSDGLYVTDDFLVTHNSSLVVIDEAAFLDQGDAVDAATSGNSDCRIWGSSVNGMGNIFARKRHGGSLRPDQIFSFHYSDDPRKTPEWAAKKKRSLEPHVWASEYELDYSASVEGICIPAKWVKAAIALAEMYPYKIPTQGIAGLDVGAGGKGKSVFVARFGALVLPPVAWGNPDTIETAHRAITEAESIRITRADGWDCTVKIMAYDSPGVGQGVQSALRHSNRIGVTTRPVNTGDTPSDVEWPDGETSDQKFLNLRAELWWTMRARFKASYELHGLLTGDPEGQPHPIGECLLLPALTAGADTQAMVSQLSLPRWHRNDKGKIVIESKKSMSDRGIPSPDHADALALTFLPNPDPLEIWRRIASHG